MVTNICRNQKHTFRPYLVHDTLRYRDDEERDNLVRQFNVKDRLGCLYTNNNTHNPSTSSAIPWLKNSNISTSSTTVAGYLGKAVVHASTGTTAQTLTGNLLQRVKSQVRTGCVCLIQFLYNGLRRVLEVRVGEQIWRHPAGFSCVFHGSGNDGRG